MPDPNEQKNWSVSLRRATVGDARLLTQLGARLFVQTFGAANTAENMAAYLAGAFTLDGSAAELADTNAAIWIAEDAGCAAVGYATLRRGAIGNGVIANAPAEVQRIYVDQPWHGRRVGETLMRSCIAQSRTWHCDALWLAVWEENPGAIAFYKKMGFQIVGSTTFILGSDRQNDLIMALPLA